MAASSVRSDFGVWAEPEVKGQVNLDDVVTLVGAGVPAGEGGCGGDGDVDGGDRVPAGVAQEGLQRAGLGIGLRGVAPANRDAVVEGEEDAVSGGAGRLDLAAQTAGQV